MQSITARIFGLVLLAGLGAIAQQPQASPQPAQPVDPELVQDLAKRHQISDSTRFQLIQTLNAEFVRVRKMLPVGEKSIVLSAEGEIRPSDGRLHQQAMAYGAACHVGDRVKITSIAFKEKGIYLEAEAGEVIILHNFLLHRSGVNRTEQPRRAFSVCYMDAATRSLGPGERQFPVAFGEGALNPDEEPQRHEDTKKAATG